MFFGTVFEQMGGKEEKLKDVDLLHPLFFIIAQGAP